MKRDFLQEVLDEMEKDPWYVKLKRHIKLKIWVYLCKTRKYWDKDFSGYLFRKKKQLGGEIDKRKDNELRQHQNLFIKSSPKNLQVGILS